MNGIRAAYLALFFVSSLCASTIGIFGEKFLLNISHFNDCDNSQPGICLSTQLVYRVSFSLSASFLLRGFFSLLPLYCCQQRCNLSSRFIILLVLELPLYIAILVGSFFLSNKFYVRYGQFSQLISGCFIIFQIICVLDFAYLIRDTLLDRIDQYVISSQRNGYTPRKTCAIILWKFAFLFLCIAAIALVILGILTLNEYAGKCSITALFILITAAASIFLILLSISSWIDVGLLPPCIVAIYLVLLCWQALSSNPDKNTCGDPATMFSSQQAQTKNSVLFNAVLGAFSITWTSWRTSAVYDTDGFSNAQIKSDKKTEFSNDLVNDSGFDSVSVQQDSLEAGTCKTQGHSPISTKSNQNNAEPWQFFAMMFLASVYMAMVLTDWNSVDSDISSTSMWVKISAEWITIFIFLWTLIAPRLFPNRSFSSNTSI